jgi:hypothetical protein
MNHDTTLDFDNAFSSPGESSLAELVHPSRAYFRNGASHRWLIYAYIIIKSIVVEFGALCSVIDVSNIEFVLAPKCQKRYCHEHHCVLRTAAWCIGSQQLSKKLRFKTWTNSSESLEMALFISISVHTWLVSYAACSRVRGFLPTYRLLTAATHSIPIVSTWKIRKRHDVGFPPNAVVTNSLFSAKYISVLRLSIWRGWVGRASYVVGRASWVVGRRSCVVGRASWVVRRGSWVVRQ